MSQDVFTMLIDQITHGLPCILRIKDNICVSGYSPEENNEHIIQPMNVAAKNSIVLNSNKYKIRQPKISFYSAKFTAKGI